ncbi:MAG: hypothetical protein ACI83P_002510 [Janthinobacterium sp.]
MRQEEPASGLADSGTNLLPSDALCKAGRGESESAARIESIERFF